MQDPCQLADHAEVRFYDIQKSYSLLSLKRYHQLQGMQIEAIGTPKSWRIISYQGADAEPEEMVLSWQGVIVHKKLPPVTIKM
jgi:hypothetical protein